MNWVSVEKGFGKFKTRSMLSLFDLSKTNWISASLGLIELTQALINKETLSSTQKYTSVSSKRLKSILEAYHPRSK